MPDYEHPAGTRHAIVAIAAKDKDSPSPAARLKRATAIAVASRKRWGRGPNSKARTDGQHANEPDAGRKDKAYDRLLAAARVNRESLTPIEAHALYEAAEALLGKRYEDSAAERLLAKVGPPDEWSGGVAAAIGPKWRRVLADLWASYSPAKQREVLARWNRMMDSAMSSLDEAQAGKRIGGQTYYHASAIPAAKADLVARAQEIAGLKPGDWNVAKIADDSSSVSLLNYHAFFTDGFPALTRAVAVDLVAKTAKSMSFQGNRPILHRKELLLEPGHPRAEEFRALTRNAEDLGLYRDSAAIGNEAEWARRCAAAGVQVKGNELVAEARSGTQESLRLDISDPLGVIDITIDGKRYRFAATNLERDQARAIKPSGAGAKDILALLNRLKSTPRPGQKPPEVNPESVKDVEDTIAWLAQQAKESLDEDSDDDFARLAMIIVVPNAQAAGFPEVGDQNTPHKYTGGAETMPIHITAGYVKVPQGQRAAALRRIAGAVMASPPLDLRVAGLHHFDNADDDRSVAVVNVSGRGLQDLNRRLVGAASVPGSVPTDKPFHAHATLRYGALGYRWPGVVPDVAFQAREVEIWQQGTRLAVIPLLGGR